MDGNKPLQINVYTNNRGKGKCNSQDFINEHSYSTLKDHHLLRMSSFGELIMDHFYCSFDPGCEVLDENNTLKMNISTNKRGKCKNNSQDFINNHSYSTFKNNHYLIMRRFI